MSQALLLANGVVGFALPGLIAVITREAWSPKAKSVAAFAVCLAAAAVTAAAAGDLTPAGWGAGVLIVFAAARTSYAGLWRPTGVAPAIEAATSPTPAPTRAEVKEILKTAPRRARKVGGYEPESAGPPPVAPPPKPGVVPGGSDTVGTPDTIKPRRS